MLVHVAYEFRVRFSQAEALRELSKQQGAWTKEKCFGDE